MASFLDGMPLSTPDHVRHGWDLVHRPVIERVLETDPGRDREVGEELRRIKDAIQLAAVSCGMDPFPEARETAG